MESHPECGLVFADCDIYHNRYKKLIRRYNWNKGFRQPTNLTIEQIIGGGFYKWTCTAMIRRNLYAQVIEGDPYLHQSEKFLLGDTQLWVEVALISEVYYIPESLATYRRLEESASKSKDPIKREQFGKSASEMKLYLCDKHKLSENIRSKQESAWCDFSLWLAFYTRNGELADKVRMRKKEFTLKEWLRYYGAKFLGVHYGYRSGAFFIGLLRKRRNQWALD